MPPAFCAAAYIWKGIKIRGSHTSFAQTHPGQGSLMVFPHCTWVNPRSPFLILFLPFFPLFSSVFDTTYLPNSRLIYFFFVQKGVPTLKDVWDWQVVWCYPTGFFFFFLHCCAAELTSLDIHVCLLACRTADLVTIQPAEFKKNKSSAV